MARCFICTTVNCLSLTKKDILHEKNICRTCIYLMDLDVRYLIPSEERLKSKLHIKERNLRYYYTNHDRIRARCKELRLIKKQKQLVTVLN